MRFRSGKIILKYALALCVLYLAKDKALAQLPARITVGTNVPDWVITVPNLTLGYDLFPGEYNRSTVHLGVKYNWNTFQALPALYVFDVFDLRGEYRYHLRLPKYPLAAFYYGPYLDGSSYSLKPGKTGRQGWQWGAGLSAGFEIPLYEYSRCAVDLDLGFCAGLSSFRYFLYENSESGLSYVPVDGSSVHGVLPVITELRAVLSFRKTSVKYRYIKTDPQKSIYSDMLRDIGIEYDSCTKESFDASRSRKEMRLYESNPLIYRENYCNWVGESTQKLYSEIAASQLSEKYRSSLRKAVRKRERAVIEAFDRELKPAMDNYLKNYVPDVPEEKL